METNYQENINFRKNEGKNYILYTFLGIILVAVIAAFVLMTKKSHYEQGTEYLSQKQYTEALSEFQKVDADEKEFRLSQSKINYIHGLNAYNDNLHEEAAVFLTKVSTDDEYYQHAQMMFEKIRDMENKALLGPGNDTLIVRQEVTEKTPKISAESSPSDVEINRTYLKQLDGLINSFESQYQAARSAPVSSKRNYAVNMSSTMNRLVQTPYAPKVSDANVTELRRLMNLWMDKRIEFIEKLMSENSISETNNSRSLKEEGDKLYYSVITQMKHVKSNYSV